MRTNAFEAVCLLADSERWCWRITCTTCGHWAFRYAFLQISLGRHPSKADWEHPASMSDATLRLGSLSAATTFVRASRVFYDVVSSASVVRIAGACRCPDFLGYLGLVLFYTDGWEPINRALTLRWGEELRTIVRPHSVAETRLRTLLGNEQMVLTWPDLEQVERDLAIAGQ